MENWFQIKGEEQVLSPALLFYSERIDQNIALMIAMAGKPGRLRPHIKTLKCRELVKRQIDAGINKFKCATLSEAKMLLEMGIEDVLLAYPLAGPEQEAFRRLSAQYPGTLSVLVDHPDQVQAWQSVSDIPIHCFIDLNVGMDRTGILPEKADKLLPLLMKNIVFRGWHIYDGHIHDREIKSRTQAVEKAFRPVWELLDRVGTEYHRELICGGSITFPIHARHEERSLSPGTTVLWDQGYGSQFKDLNFRIAACLATRVVSKPADDLLCLNLGYKAVAAEMSAPCVYFPQLPDAIIVNHSEEHLVLKTGQANQYRIGAMLYAFPWHICPTVALHESAHLIQNQQAIGPIPIEARKRLYTYG
ncbi:MAG TPA: D-TA family PLP-dependent enzyme [Saprospiraceae bacterium]|nr:D-TA family PLP-dependent enzyme [Saprospiraceae bacterium]